MNNQFEMAVADNIRLELELVSKHLRSVRISFFAVIIVQRMRTKLA